MDDEVSDRTDRPLSQFHDVTLAVLGGLIALAVLVAVTWFLWLQLHGEAESLFDVHFNRSETRWT